MSEALLAAFRHDAHKFLGESHAHASDTFAGIRVNQSVPQGADADAAALSRPYGEQTQTVPNYATHERLSLLTGEPVVGSDTPSQSGCERKVADLLTISEAATAHERWLASDVAATVNESVYHPYTSLKYHTLLVAALLDNYRSGHDFDDLRLVIDPADEIVPCRTVFDGDRFTLRVDANDEEQPSTRIGSRPSRSWASTWNRLSAHPLETTYDKYDMILDANLRRLRSWSTALQYIEDFTAWRPTR